MALPATGTKTPVQPRPNYPTNPNGNAGMYQMMQMFMMMMQMMMSQFQGGGQQHYGQNPYGAQGGYGQQNPTPFNYFGGGGAVNQYFA